MPQLREKRMCLAVYCGKTTRHGRDKGFWGFTLSSTVDRSRLSDVSCRLFPSECCECGGDLVIAGQLRGVLRYQDGDSPFCANRRPSRKTVSRRIKGKHELNNRHQFRRLACEDTSTSLPVSDVQLVGVCARAEAGWYQ